MTENSGACRRNQIQALQLPLGLRHDLCRWMRCFESGSQLVGLTSRIAFAKFPLDGFHLLAQIRLALGIGKLGCQILLQLLLDLGDLELGSYVRLHRLTRRAISSSSRRACFARIDIQVRSEKVSQLSAVADIQQNSPRLIGMSGESSIIFMAFSRKFLISASHCLLSAGGAELSRTRISALRNGWVKTNRPTSIRCRIWTMMRIVSSG